MEQFEKFQDLVISEEHREHADDGTGVYHYMAGSFPFNFAYNNDEEIVTMHAMMHGISIDTERWVCSRIKDVTNLKELQYLVSEYSNTWPDLSESDSSYDDRDMEEEPF